MNKKRLLALGVGGVLAVAGGGFLLLHNTNVAVFNAQGTIARQERTLIITALLLSLIIVLPVFYLLFSIAWRYRESNTGNDYRPDWDGNRWAETVWWLIPLALISVLGVITWHATHKLDPFMPIASNQPALRVQVVALQWKWLFIYPEDKVASLNALYIPAGRPVDFEITSDAPMNSLWIPQLAGQVYAMSGMSTQLHLVADHPGQYRGSSANISGRGFAAMHFIATAKSATDYQAWLQTAKQSPSRLSLQNYTQLARPSQNDQPTTYSHVQSNLYAAVVNKYMEPGGAAAGDTR